jgi:hypothetical protein
MATPVRPLLSPGKTTRFIQTGHGIRLKKDGNIQNFLLSSANSSMVTECQKVDSRIKEPPGNIAGSTSHGYPQNLCRTTLDTLKDYYWNNKKLHEIESFSVSPAPTPAINPTIAVQFRHSILVNSTNWNDKGHEDSCLEELNTMIRSFLPSHIKVSGLKRVTFASGQNSMHGDPSMLSSNVKKLMNQSLPGKCSRSFASSIENLRSVTMHVHG